MNRKYNKYTVCITDDYMTSDYSEEKHLYEWASQSNPEFKPVYKEKKGFNTFKEALDYVYSLNTSDSIIIDDVCCGEVYSSINVINKCKCCNNTTYDKMTSDSHHTEKKSNYHLIEKQ